MFSTKKLIIAALFIAIGITLPLTFHAIPRAGQIFLPMHIPILMSGIILGLPYGIVVGIITPILSSLFTGMPPAPILPAMVCELAAYGAVSSLLMFYVPIKNIYARVYISLIGAMLFGRVFFGVVNALIFAAGDYSMRIWLTGAFVTALPGIVIQIVIIPAVVIALQKTKLIEMDWREPRCVTGVSDD